IAMEYSPRCAIPYIARVDAGTVERIRGYGVEVVSSGDLVQRFSAVWRASEIASHIEASEKLYRVKDRAFEAIAARTRDRVPTTEYDIQQLMVKWFNEERLISDSEPMVSAMENSGTPPESRRISLLHGINVVQVVLPVLGVVAAGQRGHSAD